MGSMWIDDAEDPNVYPMQGLPAPALDDTKLTSADRFPDQRWGADFRSLLWLIDFTAVDDWPGLIAQRIPLPPEPDSQDMKDGLKDLVDLQQTVREAALPEIVRQNTGFQMYFCSQLGIYPRTYPESYLMLKVVARIGELAMVKLKYRYKAVRPSQIYPRLTPPLPVAPHASYPSGHATISHLMALMAKEIVPDLDDAAYRLARRIARNREIAGLHFWWDSRAGELAAGDIFDIIKNLSRYTGAVAKAQAEWA